VGEYLLVVKDERTAKQIAASRSVTKGAPQFRSIPFCISLSLSLTWSGLPQAEEQLVKVQEEMDQLKAEELVLLRTDYSDSCS
jgi:hypothetical protein